MTDEPPVKKAAAKKAVKKAPAKKAPAKKAPAKKAPAKKAPAKKAPAKRAAAQAADRPRATILNRIQELEERIAADAPLPPAEPRLRPRRTSLAPPPESVVAPAEVPAEEPVEEPVEERPAPVVTAVPEAAVLANEPTPEPVAEQAPEPAPLPESPVFVDQPTQVVPVQRTDGSGVLVNRLLAGLVVVLLALAAGFGAAAATKERPATWRAEQVVDLLEPSSPGPELATAVETRLRVQVSTSGFAGLIAAAAGVRGDELREYVKTREAGSHQLVLVVRAAHADAAVKLADAAGRQFLLNLAADQGKVTDVNQRLGGQVTQVTSKPVREKPSDDQAWLAGLLAGVAVLLVGAVAIAFMTSSPRRD